jgi:hypothetical protein
MSAESLGFGADSGPDSLSYSRLGPDSLSSNRIGHASLSNSRIGYGGLSSQAGPDSLSSSMGTATLLGRPGLDSLSSSRFDPDSLSSLGAGKFPASNPGHVSACCPWQPASGKLFWPVSWQQYMQP